ncbi:MAG: hypothetical protein LUD76_03985 [Alistipes sp.]|nr:hypothetical protein [Alistipes sp.]
MKKLLTTLCVAALAFGAKAQDNLLQFFPNKEGSQIVSKCYDANDALQGTMTLTIAKNYEYYDGQELDINYVMEDAVGNTMNQGTIQAQYIDGNFYLDMKSHALSPTIGQYVSMSTELSGDFLDYPNLFPDPWMLKQEFDMDGGEFQIRSADSKQVIASVRVYNRDIKGTEKVTTPAGEFDATKISFMVDVVDNGVEKTYHGMEWYSAGAGIVRSEIYDSHHNLQDYTVLTSISK